MADPDRNFKSLINSLYDNYLSQLKIKLEELKKKKDLIQSHQDQKVIRQVLNELMTQSHQISEISENHGFLNISESSKKLEYFCQSVIHNVSNFSEKECHDIEYHVLRLLDGYNQYSEKKSDLKEKNRLFYYLKKDPNEALRLKIGLQECSYQVIVIYRLNNLTALIEKYRPLAIIFDLDLYLKSSKKRQISSIRDIRKELNINCPLIVLTTKSDLDTRFEVLKAGCDKLLIKPVLINEIIQVVEKFTIVSVEKSERVLITDHTGDMIKFFKKALEGEGMIVAGFLDSELTMDAIETFNPDIILIDFNIARFHGTELAAIIRQKEEFIGLPILFLASEIDQDIQIDSIDICVNDFLIKP